MSITDRILEWADSHPRVSIIVFMGLIVTTIVTVSVSIPPEICVETKTEMRRVLITAKPAIWRDREVEVCTKWERREE